MEQGVRVKDLDPYEGDINRNDLSFPVDANDFVTGKRITGQQMKKIIGTDIDTIKTDVGALKTDNTANKTNIANLQTDVTKAKGDITTAQTDITGLKTDVGTLKTDNTTNKSDISTLKTDVAGVPGLITASENKQDIYNVTVKNPPASGYHTADTARAAVPTAVRKLGLLIAYSTATNTWVVEQFTGTAVSVWTTATNWQKIATQTDIKNLQTSIDAVPGLITVSENKWDIYNVTVKNPPTSGFHTADTARNAVPTAFRKLGLVIVYSIANYSWNTDQFTGTALSQWTDARYWQRIGGADNIFLIYEKGAFTPTVDVVNATLDLGAGAYFIIGNKGYSFSTLWPGNPEKYRTIPLTSASAGSDARVLWFNKITNDFEVKNYNDFTYTLDSVIVGTIRNVLGTQVFRCNFPFAFKYSDEIPPFYTNVSLVPNSENFTDIPVVDINTKTLDLGVNATLIIGNKNIALSAIWKDNPEKFRAIPLAGINANAKILYFNVVTNEFELAANTTIYTKDSNRVLIGTVYSGVGWAETAMISVNLPFPFRYSNFNNSLIKGSLKYRTNAKIGLTRGLNLGSIAPENSLDSIELAARAGYDYFETDTQVTKDGVIIISHYDTTGGLKNAEDYSAAVQSIPFNNIDFADLRANYVLASPNTRMRRPVPTLEELCICCHNNHIIPLVEIKDGFSNDLAYNIYKICNRILGDGNYIINCKSSAPTDYIRSISETADLLYDSSKILGGLRDNPHNIAGIGGNLTQEQMSELKRKNIRTAIVSSVSAFDDAIKIGVDFIESSDVGPNLDGRPGNVLVASGDWKKFKTTGSIVDDTVVLNNGQTIIWYSFSAYYLSAYYLKVTYKGSIKIGTSRLTVTKTSPIMTSFIAQGLLPFVSNNGITITATADGTVIGNIEFVSVDL